MNNKLLAGIDLAWQADSNPTAIAIGELDNRVLTICSVEDSILGIESVYEYLISVNGLKGIAIDAP